MAQAKAKAKKTVTLYFYEDENSNDVVSDTEPTLDDGCFSSSGNAVDICHDGKKLFGVQDLINGGNDLARVKVTIESIETGETEGIKWTKVT